VEVRILASGLTWHAQRGASIVALEPHEMRLLATLEDARAAQQAKPPESRGFVRSIDLAGMLADVFGEPNDLATALVRRLARRLERRLEALGQPPVLELCERRGVRLIASLAR
jgi:hypothetical protein